VKPTIGVLALQGGVSEHVAMLKSLNCSDKYEPLYKAIVLASASRIECKWVSNAAYNCPQTVNTTSSVKSYICVRSSVLAITT